MFYYYYIESSGNREYGNTSISKNYTFTISNNIKIDDNMNFLMRAILSLLLLFTLSIPVISDCVAMAIESRFKYMMLLF